MAEIEKLEPLAWVLLGKDGARRSLSWSAPSAETLEIAAIEGEAWQALLPFSPERVLALLEVVRAAKEAHRVMAELLPNEPETYALELAFDALEQT